MDPGEIKIEEVLKKWEKHHPPPTKTETDEKPWYQQPLSEYSNVNQRRRERKHMSKKSTPDYVNESHYIQKKFRVIPPILNIDIQNYQTSQCSKCQSVLQYFPTHSKDSLINSQSLSLFDYVATKNSLKWYGAMYFQSILLAACYQSKDELLLKQVCQKQHPVLLIHDAPGFFSSVLLYMFYASFGKVPYAILNDEDVSSPILKYFMKKIGFVFVVKDTDGSYSESTAETIIDILKSNDHVLIGLEENNESMSLPGRIFSNVFNALRKDDKLLKRLLLIPVTLSIETGFNSLEKSSLFGILREWFYFPKLFRGLAQFNISKSVKYQSVLKMSAELNEQDSSDEENNLILRHIAYDLLETGVILPTNLVSFLLITKYRDSVCIDVLNDTVEWLIHELRNMGGFIGFSGETKDITHHALNILKLQDVLEVNTETKLVVPKTNSCVHLQKLFENSKKIIHMFMTKAILASSIVACLGGHQGLTQGSGYNVKCRGDQLLEKGEYLAEMLSFLLDFCCPFNKITDDLIDSLEKMVTMDILSTYTDTYENQSHQKLVHSFTVDTALEDEEYVTAQGESDISYDVSVQDNVVQMLYFLSSCILPFVEITFTVIAIIREYGEGIFFSVKTVNEVLTKRFEDGFFPYGEMVTANFISRVFDYLYEKEVIDEYDGGFLLSASFNPGKGDLEQILTDIAVFR